MRRTSTLLVALLAITATAAPVPKAKKASPFPLEVGTKWEYVRNGNEDNASVEELVSVEEAEGATVCLLRVTYPSGKTEAVSYRLSKGEVALANDGGVEYTPAWVIAKAGMKAGDEWDASAAFTMDIRGEMKRIDLGGKMVVGKPEELTTPAGKFTATPVTHKRGRSEVVYWYADGVGLVRQTSSSQKEPILELKAFTRGKK